MPDRWLHGVVPLDEPEPLLIGPLGFTALSDGQFGVSGIHAEIAQIQRCRGGLDAKVLHQLRCLLNLLMPGVTVKRRPRKCPRANTPVRLGRHRNARLGAEHERRAGLAFSKAVKLRHGQIVGTLGVIGSTRLPCNKMIQIVEITSKLVSSAFSHSRCECRGGCLAGCASAQRPRQARTF